MKAYLAPLLALLIVTGGEGAPLPLAHPASPRRGASLESIRQAFLEGRIDEVLDGTHAKREGKLAFEEADLLAWAARARGRESEAFEYWRRALETRDPEGELVLSPLLALDPGMKAYDGLCPLLDEMGRSAATPPLLATRCLETLGELLRSSGKREEARKSFSLLGRIDRWSVIGPFPNAQKTGFDRAFPPETRLDFGETCKGKRGPVRWRSVPQRDYDGQVGLGALLYPSEWAVAYGVTFCRSPERQKVALRASANDNLKLWCNGRLLLASDRQCLARIDQHVAVAELAPGWNAILCKVSQEAGGWEFGLRITDLDGRLLKGLEFRARPPKGWSLPLRTPGPSPEADRAGARILIERDRLARPSDPWPLFREARWLESKSFRERAIRAYEKLTTLAPNCPSFWTRLGRLYGQEDQGTQSLRSLMRALAIDGNHAPALYELAKRYRSKGLEEKARKVLESCVAKAPGYHSARALLSTVYRKKGWKAEALSVARTLVSSLPSSPMAWSVLAMAHLDLQELAAADHALERSLALEADDASEARRLAFHRHMAGKSNSACALLEEQLAFYPLDHGLRLDLAGYRRASGQISQALALCDEILEFCPRHAKAHATKGRILLLAGRRAEGLASLQRALHWRPDDLALQEYLSFLAPEKDAIADRYGLGEEEIDAIIASAPGPEAHPRASGLILENRRIEEVRDDGSSIVHVHVLVKILNRRGKKKYGQIRLGNPRNLRLHKALVHQADGSKLEASSVRNGEVTFPSLSIGSVIEYRYDRHDYSGGWLEDHFSLRFFFQKLDPLRHGLLVVDMPEKRKLTVFQKDGRLLHRKRNHGSRIAWEWEARDLPALRAEVYMPPVGEIAAQVFVTTIPSWAYLSRWQNSLISDQFETDDAIRAKVHELVAPHASPMERVRAIYDFVVREIRYENLDVGIFGKKPDKAVKVFADRFGDCKDKATLLSAMLGEVGIRAHYAAVRTNDRGPVILELPSPQTNHIITWIPPQKGIAEGFFCDATTRYNDLRTLRTDDQGVDAFVLTGKGHRFIRTPIDPPEHNLLSVTYDGRIRADRSLICTASFRATGWMGAAHRQRYRNEGKREELLEAALNGLVPGARLDSMEFSDLEDLGAPVHIQARFTVPDYLGKEGSRAFVFRRPQPLNLLQLAPRKSRFNDFFHPRTYVTEVEESFAFPEGWHLARPLAAMARKGPGSSWEQIPLDAKGERHHVRRRFSFGTFRLNRSRYEKFRELVVEVDRIESRPVILLAPKLNP